jgi:asparagine synthetase B (glutamine-hydrolysing)
VAVSTRRVTPAVRKLHMCGIGGFSLSKTSNINPRLLSNALLSELDVRGNQASGYAFRSPVSQGVFKKAVSGAQLSMKSMSRKTTDAILHTRFATHGSIAVSANNHPVQSPDKSIDLIHNGVIYNHELIRTEIDELNNLPEVDSSVVPAILQEYDRDFNKLNMIDGDAAVAWLDRNDPDTLWVARISHSPLFIAQLEDGSFVFASTESILLDGLDKLELKPVYCEPVPERTIIGIRNGRMDIVQAIPELDKRFEDTSWYSYGKYRNMTSGGHNALGESPSYAYNEIETWDENTYTSSGSNLTPKYVAVQSAWGDILVPQSETLESEYPTLDGFFVNEYGEYFDEENGTFIGDFDDMADGGFFNNQLLFR